MRRLFQASAQAPDGRAAMFAVAALMVLLLPMLLVATSAQKLTGLSLGVPGSSEAIPPEPPGAVERLTVQRMPEGAGGGFLVSADVRNTDVLASAGDTEHKEVAAADLIALQSALSTFKALDPKRERVTLVPAPDSTTAEVVRWMDAVRAGPEGVLFPRVILAAPEVPSGGDAP